jgi:phage tail sheath protein FI
VTIARSVNIVGNATPGVITKVPLVGGSEGVAAIDVAAAAQLLGQINKSLVINVPGATSAEVSSVVTWAEGTGKHFVVADVPKPAANETDAQSVTAMTTYSAALPASSAVGIYGPWYYAADPGSTAGAMRLTAPGGAVVAQILRTDASRGVHKAPAGVATAISGALQPYLLYTNAQQDTLAQSAVNLIKPVPGSGICIWGARTKAVGTSDRYVPVRRLLIAMKASLTNLTRFAAFENNDEDMREVVEDAVRRYLQTQFDLGALKGSSPEQAFFVRCDSTNNPPAVEESGTLVIEVGVALKTPAEFILIRIGQQEAGTTVADSLEEI